MTALATDESWPPHSARQALLSSPSGRKRYADFQAGMAASPLKNPAGTPTLLDRLRLARNNQDSAMHDPDEEEEDEETLQLKLAAIEAKLKLKKLQAKAKKEDGSSSSRPTSAGGSTSRIEVTLSPIKRTQTTAEQKSPSRVLLGIDKGVTGAEVSLRRARTIDSSKTREGSRSSGRDRNQPDSRASTAKHSRAGRQTPLVEIKSFSERMAEVRGNDRKQAEKRGDAFRSRARNFNLDAREMENFKAAAVEPRTEVRPRSPIRRVENSEPSHPNGRNHQSGLRKAKTLPDLRGTAEEHQGDAALFEGFSGLHLSSRILPHSFLKRTLPSDEFTIYRVPDLLKNVTSPTYEIPDEVGNFVVFGIIASQSNALDQKNKSDEQTKSSNEWEKKWDDGSQNRKKFMVMTLTDLKWTVDLYLFDTALPRYHRLTPGTVIAVLNPSIMPPKRGREDTGAFSLALHDGDDTVLEIGKSKHLGYCNVTKKDGKACGQWVDAAKSEICEWHLNAQIAKTQAKRMGVNTGGNGFGGNGPRNRTNVFDPRLRGEGSGGGYGLLPTKQGRGFDQPTGSHYYISNPGQGATGAPLYNPEVSTARMLDLDNGAFVAEGQFQRDKEALLQRRMAAQEKERSIARQLANLGGGSGAGADYMRRRADGDTSLKPRSDGRHRQGQDKSVNSTQSETADPRSVFQDLKVEIGRKRAAQDVRLSPVKKKTRFLTDRGIKETGRESIGSEMVNARMESAFDDNDDDDLDIV